MGLLNRFGSDGQVSHLVELAVEAEVVLRPQSQDDVQGLLGAHVPGVEVDVEVAVLVVCRAAPHAEVQPALAQHIQHGALFSQEDGVVEGQDADAGANAYLAGAAGDVAKQGHQRRTDAVAAGVVLGNPHRVEAKFLGVFRLFQHFAEDSTLCACFLFRPRAQQKKGKLHNGFGPPSGWVAGLLYGDCFPPFKEC